LATNLVDKLVNILFSLTLVVWVIFDFLKLLYSPISPASHLIPECLGMFFIGFSFGDRGEVSIIWPLIMVILISATIYGLVDNALFSIIGINLLLVLSFVAGYFTQERVFFDACADASKRIE